MIELKCPVCNQPLHDDHDGYYSCYSDNCCVSGGTLDTWQELIRTTKQLEIYREFITKLYLNGNITGEHLERLIKALDNKVE